MPTEQTNIVPGSIMEGKVQGITSFGAFIELPGWGKLFLLNFLHHH
jgi:S1 RNA binding domain protein